MLRTALRLTCPVVLLACATAAPGLAQPLDKRTLFNFSGPVAMPGVTLPAGEYLFRLANPDSGRNVVQVLSADGTKAYGMFFSMRAERFEAASTPEVRFMETAAGMPAAIKTWWYPGERGGYEFVYPKEQARRLALGAGEPVLTTQSQTTTTEETNTANLTRLSSTGQEANLSADVTPTASTPGGTNQPGVTASSTLAIASPVIPPSVDRVPLADNGRPAQMARASLPRTASALPTASALGLLALFASGALWVWRQGRV